MLFLSHLFAIYLISIFLCCADVWWFFLFTHQTIYLLLCLASVEACHARSILYLVPLALLMMFESHVMYGSYSCAIISLIPIATIAPLFRTYTYTSHFYPVILTVISLTCSSFAHYYIPSWSPAMPCTLSIFCSNMVLTALFSLKLVMGKTRQSLMRSIA